MQEFSEMCKSLIQSSNMSIYKIAKNSGLERTALNRMINGNRLLNQKDFGKFCDTVRMGTGDRQRLHELYLIEKLGKKKYENHRYILDMLRSIDSLEWENQKEGRGINGLTIHENQMMEGEKTSGDFWSRSWGELVRESCVNGVMRVKILLRNALHVAYQRDSDLYTNIPASYTGFFEEMEYLNSIYQKKLSVYHYLMLHPSPLSYRSGNYNLEVLRYILPSVFSNHQQYYPFYSYSNSMLEDMMNTVMPYFLVTDDCVIQMASDMDSAIIHTGARITGLYHDRIRRECQGNMHSLLNKTDDIADPAEKLMEAVCQMGKLTHCLEAVPDLAAFYLLQKRKILAEGFCYIFSESGLHAFCDTDGAAKQPGPRDAVISSRQRMDIRQKLTEEAEKGRYFIRVTKQGMPKLQGTKLCLYQHGLSFMLFREQHPFRMISVTESSLCESFREFLDSLEQMGLAADQEETAEQLHRSV